MKPQTPKKESITTDFVVPLRRRAGPPPPVNPTIPPKNELTAAELRAKKAKKSRKKFKLWFFEIWRPLVITIIVAAVITGILGFRIGALTPGLSTPEHDYITSVRSGKNLLEHPSFLIHKLPTYVLFKLGAEKIAYYRMVSAVFGAAAVLGGFYVLRRWYSVRVALLGSGLMLTSAWLLHTARLATPESSFLLLMPLLWMAVWMYTTQRRQFAMICLAVVGVICFYIPGFLWLVLGAFIWQRKNIVAELRTTTLWFKLIATAGVLIGLSPLIYGASQNPKELLLLAGLPDTFPNIVTAGRTLLDIPLNIFARGAYDPVRWLGRLPLFDIFSSAMLLLGIYSMRHHILLIRAQLLIGSLVVLVALIAVGGPVTNVSLLPILYILVAAGIAFLLQQWFAVFPRNPIARGFATTLVSVLVLLVSYHHISHYFIAWPETPATRDNFSQSLVK